MTQPTLGEVIVHVPSSVDSAEVVIPNYSDPPGTHIKIEGVMRNLRPEAAAGFVDAGYQAIEMGKELDEKKAQQRGVTIEQLANEKRTQQFEEGDVTLFAFPRYDEKENSIGRLSGYLMAFYDVEKTKVCARPHIHPYGERAVFIFTGPDTTVNVRSLSKVTSDEMLADIEAKRTDPNEFTIPPNSAVVVRIPKGVSHQFIPQGGNALAISIHPDEVQELQVTKDKSSMASQTAWLLPQMQSLEECKVRITEAIQGGQLGSIFAQGIKTARNLLYSTLATPKHAITDFGNLIAESTRLSPAAAVSQMRNF